MHLAAADVVAVFGQIRQVAEVSESTDHAHRLVATQALEQLLEGFVGLVVGVPAKCDRQGADLFDEVIRLNALLLAYHIPQNPAQQADVLHQRTFVVFGTFGRGWSGGVFHGDHASIHSYLWITNGLRLCNISPSPRARAALPFGKQNTSKHCSNSKAIRSPFWA